MSGVEARLRTRLRKLRGEMAATSDVTDMARDWVVWDPLTIANPIPIKTIFMGCV